MRIIARKTLNDFILRYPDSKNQIDSWYYEVKRASWHSPGDVKINYPRSRNIGKDRVIFNIMRNKYRLIVKVNYNAGIVFIRFIGTHKEYDNVNVEEV